MGGPCKGVGQGSHKGNKSVEGDPGRNSSQKKKKIHKELSTH